jgi:putative transposase
VQRLTEEFETSERHAWELMSIPRSSYRYRSRRDDTALRERLIQLARERPGFGYRRLHMAPQILLAPNQEWAIDFANDVAASGQRLPIFSVVDAFTRECLALETDTSLPNRRITHVLE